MVLIRVRPYRRLPIASALAAVVVIMAGSPASAADPDTERPSTPTNVVASVVTETSVTLTWQPSTDDVGVVGYDVSYQVSDYVLIKRVSVPEVTLSVDRSRPYTFSITAVDAARNVSSSARITVNTPPVDTEAPTAPTGVTVRDTSPASVTVEWRPSRDDVEVHHYDVLSITDAGTTVVGRNPGPPGPMTSADISRLTPDTDYTFAVRAVDLSGNVSEPSAPVTFRTPAPRTCAVAYRVNSRWPAGFHATVTVRNLSPAAVNAWELRWTYPGGQRVQSAWDAALVDAGPAVVVANPSWNTGIAAGASVSFGLIGTTDRAFAAAPSAFTVNGATCQVD